MISIQIEMQHIEMRQQMLVYNRNVYNSNHSKCLDPYRENRLPAFQTGKKNKHFGELNDCNSKSAYTLSIPQISCHNMKDLRVEM